MTNLKSILRSTASSAAGAQNEGQPDPDSNFCSVRKSGAPQPAHFHTPRSFTSLSGELHGGSVPSSCSTRYTSGLRRSRHSSSVSSRRMEMGALTRGAHARAWPLPAHSAALASRAANVDTSIAASAAVTQEGIQDLSTST
eukprot:scaffold68748_cov29-Tisochrysis_lutea.AAC.2